MTAQQHAEEMARRARALREREEAAGRWPGADPRLPGAAHRKGRFMLIRADGAISTEPEPERVIVEYTAGYIKISQGKRRWCFPNNRELTPAEQRTFDRLAELERARW